MNKPFHKILVFAFIALVSGCASKSMGKKEITSLSEVKNDEIIIVGKIQLNPRLDESEQFFYEPFPLNLIFGESPFKNKIFIGIGNKPIDITHKEAMWADSVTSVDLGKTFFIKTKKTSSLYFSGGIIRLNNDPGDELHHPGGLKYLTKPGDKAIYIGTIEYHREFNEVTKTKVLNHYSEARVAFVEKFGNSIKLKRAKPHKIRIKTSWSDF